MVLKFKQVIFQLWIKTEKNCFKQLKNRMAYFNVIATFG